MRISIDEAEARLDELVDRAEAGEEVILTRDGLAIVKLVPKEARGRATSLDCPNSR
jgi:prevent-host-death family protein